MTIIPHLWFNDNAIEAVTTYTKLFKDSKINWQYTLKDTPSGDCDLLSFYLVGHSMAAIAAGPYFQLNEAISIMVGVQSNEEIDRLYQTLSQGGHDLIPLQEYPFNPYYVWVADRFGLTWQLLLMPDQETTYSFEYSLLFAGDNCGRAEEAINYYADVFSTKPNIIVPYPPGQAQDPRAKVAYGSVTLDDTYFTVMDHGYTGDKAFNEAFSFMLYCDSQEELDYYWSKLSAVPDAEQCGWCKDQFGVSWQIIPSWLRSFYGNSSATQIEAVSKAMMPMKKLDDLALRQALAEVE